MTTYYVSTLARYVLVDADDESGARVAGQVALCDLNADVRHRLGREVPIEIRLIRPATTDEIEMMTWFNQRIAQEAEFQASKAGSNP